MTQIVQVAVVALATAVTGAAAVTAINKDIPDLAIPEGDWSAGTALDGRTFRVVGTDLNSGTVMEEDELVFKDGTFQSANCEVYCEFGWSDYQTKVEGDVIHFTARTTCPDAPHTVVWYGTVTGDDIHVEGTWTTRRWYWTHQIEFATVGSPSLSVGETVSG